jgi:chromosome partitioning protein
MNIVVSNVKGGVGKTTSAVYLAGAAAERGREAVYLVDADRQASSAEWLETRPVPGVELVEAPSERTVAKAMEKGEGIVIPTRAGGVEPNRVVATLEMTPANIPAGVVICSARLGTRDLEATVAWWAELEVPVWGIIPERVSIASGPAANLSSEGLELYGQVLRKALGKRR